MNLWSVPRPQSSGGFKRLVEVARFFPDRTLVRLDEPWQKALPNLTFVLCRTFGPPKEDLLVHRATFRLDLTSSRFDPKTQLKFFVWDAAFNYDTELLTTSERSRKANERKEDSGRVRWFLEEVGAALLEEEFDHSSDILKCRSILASEPRPGHLFLGDDELEVYRTLGEDLPFLWLSFDDFFAWAEQRPEAHVFTTGG